jgi:GTPase SAR1 family protein
MWIVDQIIFKCPFTLMIAGPSGAGKTSLLEKILINKKTILDKQPQRIVFCYKNNQVAYDVFNLFDVPVEFIKGIPEDLAFDPKINNILIIDDLMADCKDNQNVADFFTRRSHHENISVIFLSQNIFMKGSCARDISLNSSYLILFDNPRDRQQIRVVGQQMFPKKTKGFMEIFDDAVTGKNGFKYILYDFKPTTEERMRIQTGIIPGEERIIYTLK